MAKDLHDKPFDEGTNAKLAIFRDYLREWLPVFLAREKPIWTTINIFDFFAGPGSDIEGTKGTPLIVLDELLPYHQNIRSKGHKVNLYFNEYDKGKCEKLKAKLASVPSGPYTVSPLASLDFKDAFENEFPKMNAGNCANLLFLDQNGVRHITNDVFRKIIGLRQTDFLFFISSFTIKRFSEQPSIAQYIKLSAEEIEKTNYHNIHRRVLEYYKSMIPKDKEYHLAPFSLKKNANIYGIIFGSGHLLGIEKFLRTCWKIDPERGEANFDIDGDNIIQGQLDLFTGKEKKPKKVDLFEQELEERVLGKTLKTNKDVYLFALKNGFLPKHAKVVIDRLMQQRKIEKCAFKLSHEIFKDSSKPVELRIL